MTALLALIPSKDWLYIGLIVALGVIGLHYHHKLIAEGIADQKVADDKATAALTIETSKQTAELKAKATMAEQAYDKEHQAIANQPPISPVRLCLNSHGSSPVVPKAGAIVAGTQSASAPAVGIQQVPQGSDSVGPVAGPDISGLLSILVGKADTVSAELREYQLR